MDDEIQNFIKVWMTAVTSLCYCYYVAASIPKGMIRLFSLLPIFSLFTILPLNLASMHLGGATAFYLVWLANFKLLLFSFDLGPLSSNPSKRLLHFISIACLPIKIKQNPSPKSPLNSEKSSNTKNNTFPSPKSPLKPPQNLETSPKTKNYTYPYSFIGTKLLLAIKPLLLAIIIYSYGYRQYFHPNVVLALYCCHICLALQIILAISVAPVRAVFGFEIEPQFHEPHLATSLQDFWGRRWNLMVSSILRSTVYNPLRRIFTRTLGRQWALSVAIVATFAVSGLMHELIYFYLARVSPTWEVTWFFVLQGICTAAEVNVKKMLTDRWRLHRLVSGPLTVGFLAVTGVWLFFPQLLRNGVFEKGIKEFSTLVDFVKHKLPLHLF